MSDESEYKVLVHPESLPDDMTQEELDDLLVLIDKKLADGTFWEEAEEIDMEQLQKDDPELYDRIMSMNDDIPEGPMH